MGYGVRTTARVVFGSLVLVSLLLVVLWCPAGAETRKESASRDQYASDTVSSTASAPPISGITLPHLRRNPTHERSPHPDRQDPIVHLINHRVTHATRTENTASASRGAQAQPEARKRHIQRVIVRLKEEARAGRFTAPPATSSAPRGFHRQMRIAHHQIAAYPVRNLPPRVYLRLYKKAAREYGFGRDWYILAAIGKVESDHGKNMGPSSAGALGPMQFLPSTWRSYGIDGNHDGVANIMDPRDAIPSAARYLRLNGAPRHWYRAIYAYNHAGWYVEKVLAVARHYRELAER